MTRTDLARKLLLGALAVGFLSAAGKSFYDHRHLQEPVVLGPGVTPPTIFVPYSIACFECEVPCEPVKP